MSSTYDPSMPVDKDLVRFLIGDTKAVFTLSDEEIFALLGQAEYPNAYLAAAAAGRRILAKGKGAVSKSVAELSLSSSTGSGSAYSNLVQSLFEQGNKIEMAKPTSGTIGTHVFRVMGDED